MFLRNPYICFASDRTSEGFLTPEVILIMSTLVIQEDSVIFKIAKDDERLLTSVAIGLLIYALLK